MQIFERKTNNLQAHLSGQPKAENEGSNEVGNAKADFECSMANIFVLWANANLWGACQS
jgi:hypothetical protein